MPPQLEIDLRAAINAISDVVQNRPKPLRIFDQIYMKSGDMVLQSEIVARWADKKRLAFIGDGDAISVCVAYLQESKIIEYGPSQIVVFDFDERIVNAVLRFADAKQLAHLSARLYNCLDAYEHPDRFDCFYTNPPWGESNEGESVKVFVQRGMEATGYSGEGLIVIGDNADRPWTQQVLANVQRFALSSGYFVQKMMSRLHSYHLESAPDLRSCNLFLKALPITGIPGPSEPITDEQRLSNFYGRGLEPRIRYLKEKPRVDYGVAREDEYEYEFWKDAK